MKLIFFAILVSLLSFSVFGQNTKSLSGTYKGLIIIKSDPVLQKEIEEKGGIYAIFFFTDSQTVAMSSEAFGIPSKGTTSTYEIIGNKIHILDKNKIIVTIRNDGKLLLEDKKTRTVLAKIRD